MLIFLVACTEHGSGGGGGGDDDTGTHLEGECMPAAGASTLSPGTFGVNIDSCTIATELNVIGSLEEWQTTFGGCGVEPPPVDFATQRVAVVHPECSNFSVQFAADAPGEVVVGILERPSGACLRSAFGVPLPRSDKPVRVATCREVCESCPPVP